MFVVLEGIDGVGKGTQCKLIQDRANLLDVPNRKIGFPRYQEGLFGPLIARYLAGEFGDAAKVEPKAAALLFAGDRLGMVEQLKAFKRDKKVLTICDRYVLSNQMHQAGKLIHLGNQLDIIEFIGKLEYQTFDLPQPDLTIVLDVPLEMSLDRIKQRPARRKDDKLDGHEADAEYLKRVKMLYQHHAARTEDEHLVCGVDSDGTPLSADTVFEKVWMIIMQACGKFRV